MEFHYLKGKPLRCQNDRWCILSWTEKLHLLWAHGLLEWYGFRPLSKALSGNQDPYFAPKGGINCSHKIKCPSVKRESIGDGGQVLWGSVDHITMKLTCLPLSNNLGGVLFHGWPKIPQGYKLVIKFCSSNVAWLVALLQYLLCLLQPDTSQRSIMITLLIQLAILCNILKFSSWAS